MRGRRAAHMRAAQAAAQSGRAGRHWGRPSGASLGLPVAASLPDRRVLIMPEQSSSIAPARRYKVRQVVALTTAALKMQRGQRGAPRGGRRRSGELAAVGDCDGLAAAPGLGAVALDLLHNVHALGHLAEDHVLAVQPGGGHLRGRIGEGEVGGEGQQGAVQCMRLHLRVRRAAALGQTSQPAGLLPLLHYTTHTHTDTSRPAAQPPALTVQRKNWEPLVLGPALAMERTPGAVCLSWKFSSANFSP